MRQRSPVKLVIFLAFLVLAGICALELAICRAMDPDLYETLITPVSHLYHETRLRVKGVSEKYALWLSEQSDERVVLAAQQRERAEERRAERLAEEEARRERENFRLLRQAERERLRLDREVARKLLEEAQLASDPALTGNLSLADPNITELLVRNGQEYLTGGIQPLYYFNQKDEPWASSLFGRDPISGYGCGPTALAMVISTLRDGAVTPAYVASWGAKAGYAAPGSGAYLSIVEGAAQSAGFPCVSIAGTDAESLVQALRDGGIVVALMGPGHFTAHGHFILLHGVAPGGEILVADPNSRENSLALWDAEVILKELSPSRNDGAPLWLFPQSADEPLPLSSP